ncbi:Vibriobactin utilization protein ViuB [Paracoccus haematequi]|uniref:Vibriobactin utilization protein ViuB n=1 Tax=Paracoccus haematequi TaxID=2491866 RepID=A0A3S4D8R6_9RHOB|nr:siderophore-interacting protein [Paracoccus haematequi]VDS07027.1 Vibriobactin utilization protein ViuB [Paracoccus haematequi]
MRHDPLPPFQTEAALPELPFATVDALIRAEAAEQGLDLHVGHGRSTWCKLPGGDEFGARMGPTGSILYIRTHARDRLHELLEAVDHHLAQHLPGLRPAWSSLDEPGAHPPNFSLAQVAGVTRIAADFLRLRLEGGDLARFAHDLIHFRLVLQPPGAPASAWPAIGQDGRTVWPKGAAALHRPAYTVRHIDPGAGWLETDIFVHDGGRTCGFAAAAAAGTAVGLTGPGGGVLAQGRSLLLGGDETAYPALARAIEAAGPDTTGECHLFGVRADYPLPRHPGIHVSHAPGGEAALADRLRREGTDADRIWLATERARLAPLKAAIADDLGIGTARAHLAAYWSA